MSAAEKSPPGTGIQRFAVTRIRSHWREYIAEACCLGAFMCSAAAFATLLQHPASPVALTSVPPVIARLAMGVAMGLTAMAIVYSPLGQRSGAHMNPAITVTFLRLGKMASGDALLYVLAQFAGGLGGIVLATQLLATLPADPAVNYVATVPGPAGLLVAFAAEAAISFGMMLLILVVSNQPRLGRFTGAFAGALVCLYITVESPLSGMSMNPARSLGPAVLAGSYDSLWIYFAAPVAGMLLAAEAFVRRRGASRVFCAKLHHPSNGRCIFHCHYPSLNEVSA